MKIIYLVSSLLIPLAAFAESNPNQVTKAVPAWAFLWQIAEIKAPTGCGFTTPGMDGSNYDPSKPFTVMLTDAKGNSDTVLVQASDIFTVVMDMVTQVATTSLSVAGKEIVTVSNPSNAPNANTLAVAKVGKVVCGVNEVQQQIDDQCFVAYSQGAGQCNSDTKNDDKAFDACLASVKETLNACCAKGGSPLCTDM